MADERYVLVPAEPTIPQLLAGCNTADGDGAYSPGDVYRAMLAAAPPPPRGEDREATRRELAAILGMAIIEASKPDIPQARLEGGDMHSVYLAPRSKIDCVALADAILSRQSGDREGCETALQDVRHTMRDERYAVPAEQSGDREAVDELVEAHLAEAVEVFKREAKRYSDALMFWEVTDPDPEVIAENAVVRLTKPGVQP